MTTGKKRISKKSTSKKCSCRKPTKDTDELMGVVTTGAKVMLGVGLLGAMGNMFNK